MKCASNPIPGLSLLFLHHPYMLLFRIHCIFHLLVIGRVERAHLVVLSARFFGIYMYRPYVVVSMRMRYMCAFLFRRVSVTVYTISSLRIPSSSAKGKRERASCLRICASSSVVRPREREATETAEEREAS